MAADRLPDPAPDVRYPECVENWPECESGAYDPRCCRFPKSCSCVDTSLLPPVSAAVSPADTIRRYLVRTVRAGEDHSPRAQALAALDVLLAVGERDRAQLAQLIEALEAFAAKESFTVDHEYGDFEAVRVDDMLAVARAVLAGEEEAE